MMRASVELARQSGTGWHTHCSEVETDPIFYLEEYGIRPVDWLYEEGLLNSQATLAHGIFLDDSERVSSTQGARLALSLENLNGVLIHHWLSGVAQLNLVGTLRSAQAAQTSFRVVGENDGADQYRLRVTGCAG
jgi:hypothetical protein